jgi:drug/metabolite transporter (DMT)-like permease
MVLFGILAALGASALFNLGIGMQALDAREAPPGDALRLSLIRRLLQKRRWVLGLFIGGLGFPLEVLAFAKAPFVVVMPLLATGLLLLLVLGVRMLDERVGRADVAGVIAMIAGIALVAAAAPDHTETLRGNARVALVVGVVAAASFVPFFLRSRRPPPAMVVILGSALGFATSSIAIKLLSDGMNKGHYLAAGVWFAVVVVASGAGILSEMTALQLRPATVVVPISFATQTFVPILLAPLFLEVHWSGADAVSVPLLGGVALIVFASTVIARRPAVGRLFAGEAQAPPGAGVVYESSRVRDVPQLRPSRRIAVAPAYNEEPTVAAVLDQLYDLVDELIVVDDGSTDNTRAVIEEWLPGHERAQMLKFDRNQGMSAAYYLAFTHLRARLSAGEIHPDDLVYTIDADGQHELSVLTDLERIACAERLDALLVQRDLSTYPLFKRFGNRTMSAWASFWAGKRLHDVESGYRIFRAGALIDALDYYKGYKYSETVEVAVVLCRLGYNVRNDVVVPVPVFRSRTSLVDAVIDLAVIPVAVFRVAVRRPRGRRLGRPAEAVTVQQ